MRHWEIGIVLQGAVHAKYRMCHRETGLVLLLLSGGFILARNRVFHTSHGDIT